MLPKLSVHSLRIGTNQVISQMTGCEDLPSCTYIMILTLMLTKYLYKLCYQAQVEDVLRVHPLQVELKVWISKGTWSINILIEYIYINLARAPMLSKREIWRPLPSVGYRPEILWAGMGWEERKTNHPKEVP